MQNVIQNNIYLTRGDTGKFEVVMEDSTGTKYMPQEGDVVRFMMKKNYSQEAVIIEKEIPNDTLMLELEPEDTKELPFGIYVYDIELTYANGDVDTFIKGRLVIGEEVG